MSFREFYAGFAGGFFHAYNIKNRTVDKWGDGLQDLYVVMRVLCSFHCWFYGICVWVFGV